jgi:Maltokinase N-terminal cap domain
MAIIHRTTLTPSKLELLAAWLPAQPWYADQGRAPELANAGGFRLDDPDGEVGIEFMVATDGSGAAAVAYLLPMTYRGAALEGAGDALIGTTDHGVLGRRWIYDGVTDPVLVGQLVALVTGQAEPQAQSVSDTADPTVTCAPVGGAATAAADSTVVENGPSGTELRVSAVSGDGSAGRLVITLNRMLEPYDAGSKHGPSAATGRLCAGWRQADGTSVRGCLAAARYA